MVISSENIFLTSVNFYCSLSFFIKRKKDAIWRKICNSLLYCNFFLSKSLSGEYCQRLLRFSLAPASSNICLNLSMLIESTKCKPKSLGCFEKCIRITFFVISVNLQICLVFFQHLFFFPFCSRD